MRRVGVGYRAELADWIQSQSSGMDCLEITAEHFFGADHKLLNRLAEQFELYVHGLGLSLGTPGPLDKKILKQFAKVADAANAKWISEHVAFTKTSEVDLGHLNPVPSTREFLEILVEHAQELADFCKRPLIMENITFDLKMHGELGEPDFLNQLCDKANCGLLLDVTNLFINSKNHRFSAMEWLREIQPSYIRQLHIVGYSLADGSYRDHHGAKIQPDLLDLLGAVLDYAPVEAVILERDARLHEFDEIADEISTLQRVATA
ncbi:MAG: DUF692 domain-containing protein [Planctomycetota bacterium]